MEIVAYHQSQMVSIKRRPTSNACHAVASAKAGPTSNGKSGVQRRTSNVQRKISPETRVQSQ